MANPEYNGANDLKSLYENATYGFVYTNITEATLTANPDFTIGQEQHTTLDNGFFHIKDEKMVPIPISDEYRGERYELNGSAVYHDDTDNKPIREIMDEFDRMMRIEQQQANVFSEERTFHLEFDYNGNWAAGEIKFRVIMNRILVAI